MRPPGLHNGAPGGQTGGCIDTVDGTDTDEPCRSDEPEPEITPDRRPSAAADGFLLTKDGDTFETVCDKLGVEK
eukprot:SAG11_NODE_18041_length_501_cov_1.830846_1_plen_73_part_01